MAEERDDRWMYVALGLIAVGYLVYANWDTIVSNVDLRRGARSISSIAYIVAPITAAIMGISRKRKTEAVRKKWEQAALVEGMIREERGVRAKVVGEKARGSYKADIRLTRNAFYILDPSGRHEHMRVLIHLDSVNDLGLFDAEYAGPTGGGGGTFTVRIVGRATFGVEFSSAQSLAWWTDIRRALGLTTDPRSQPAPDGAKADTGT